MLKDCMFPLTKITNKKKKINTHNFLITYIGFILGGYIIVFAVFLRYLQYNNCNTGHMSAQLHK